MTLDKAIELLTAIRQTGHYQPTRDDVTSIELSIEALKRVKWHNQQHLGGFYEPLPGETKD